MQKTKNKIILQAEGELIDKASREYCSIIDIRLQTINERTKNHTKQIKECLKKIKKLEEYIKENKE